MVARLWGTIEAYVSDRRGLRQDWNPSFTQALSIYCYRPKMGYAFGELGRDFYSPVDKEATPEMLMHVWLGEFVFLGDALKSAPTFYFIKKSIKPNVSSPRN